MGKYVRKWVECFTALSGKLPRAPEKNHNENPVITYGIPAKVTNKTEQE
jgi:hypothetical protein